MRQIIKNIFGINNNMTLKIHISCFITGILFSIFAIMNQKINISVSETFSVLSGVLLAIWLITAQDTNSVWEIFKEFMRLFACFVILIFSLEFCIVSVYNFQGIQLIVRSILYCVGLLCCSIYLVSKFFDIFSFFKKIFKQIKVKLFGSVNPDSNRIKTLIENTTTILVSIAGLGVAIKTIVEPLIKIIKQLL